MKKSYLLYTFLVVGIISVGLVGMVYGGNKFSGMTTQQKLDKRDFVWNERNKVNQKMDELNEIYFKTDDAKNSVSRANMKPETKQLLDKIDKLGEERAKYEKEASEISLEEDTIDYVSKFKSLMGSITRSNDELKEDLKYQKYPELEKQKAVQEVILQKEDLKKEYEKKEKEAKQPDYKQLYKSLQSDLSVIIEKIKF